MIKSRFLKYYLPLLIAVLAFGIFALRYLIANYPSTVKYFVGETKIISPAKKAVISINGVDSNRFQLFESGNSFYFIADDERMGFDMLVIDKAKNDVALPNGGCRDVFFSKYLFLADCGYGGVFFSDKVKMDGFDTRLKITDSTVSFVLPDDDQPLVPKYQIEIAFKGK